VTAIGSLLTRASKQMPGDSPLREDLKEVQEITQSTLNKVRGLSQALHPVLLEEALEATLDVHSKQWSGKRELAVHYENPARRFPSKQVRACISIAWCRRA